VWPEGCHRRRERQLKASTVARGGLIKTVLFIAYNFPPHGGPAVQRSAKFVKYLHEFGWHPTVVAAAQDAAKVADYSLLKDVPQDVSVQRVSAFSMPSLQRAANRLRLGLTAVAVNVLLQLPDAARFWTYKVRPVVEDIIAHGKPAVVYTTSPPHSSHLVGAWVRRQYAIPWLADFRDPWSAAPGAPYLPGYKIANRLMERRVLDAADRVVCVTEPWLQVLKQNSDSVPAKFIAIPNGYDEEDFSSSSRQPQESLVITFMGTLYRRQRPELFFRALQKLFDSGRIPPDRIKVRLVGRNLRARIPEIGEVEVSGYVPHETLQELRRDTDVLLLVLATSQNDAGTTSGKIYEYMASNRPILAIVPKNGVAQKLIEATRTGTAVDGDVDAIAQAIEQLYRQWQQGFPDWNPNWEVIKQYTRRNLTAKLAAVFDEMVEEDGQ